MVAPCNRDIFTYKKKNHCVWMPHPSIHTDPLPLMNLLLRHERPKLRCACELLPRLASALASVAAAAAAAAQGQ